MVSTRGRARSVNIEDRRGATAPRNMTKMPVGGLDDIDTFFASRSQREDDKRRNPVILAGESLTDKTRRARAKLNPSTDARSKMNYSLPSMTPQPFGLTPAGSTWYAVQQFKREKAGAIKLTGSSSGDGYDWSEQFRQRSIPEGQQAAAAPASLMDVSGRRTLAPWVDYVSGEGNTGPSAMSVTAKLGSFTEEQINTLTYTLLGEAEGEGPAGMAVVASVIRNRTKSPFYPDDPVEVALQDYQFSTWNEGKGGNQTQVQRRNPVGSDGYNVARTLVESYFVDGTAPDVTGNTINYTTPNANPAWAPAAAASAYAVVEMGGHKLYTQEPIATSATKAIADIFGTEDTAPANTGNLAPISYTNQGARRNKPVLTELESAIQEGVTAVYGPDYRIEIMSGKGHYGTRRHEEGHAGDVWIYSPDGHKLSPSEMVPLAQHWLSADVGSVGLPVPGNGNSLHLDLIGGTAPGATPLRKKEGRFWFYGGEDSSLRSTLNASLAGKAPDYAFPLETVRKGLIPPSDIGGDMVATDLAVTGPQAPQPAEPMGLIEKGNINLDTRPTVKNADGSISTVRSMSFEEDGVEVLIPTVSPTGKIMSDDQAIDFYERTGQHLGKFSSPEAATVFAGNLHNQQASQYVAPAAPPPAPRRDPRLGVDPIFDPMAGKRATAFQNNLPVGRRGRFFGAGAGVTLAAAMSVTPRLSDNGRVEGSRMTAYIGAEGTSFADALDDTGLGSLLSSRHPITPKGAAPGVPTSDENIRTARNEQAIAALVSKELLPATPPVSREAPKLVEARDRAQIAITEQRAEQQATRAKPVKPAAKEPVVLDKVGLRGPTIPNKTIVQDTIRYGAAAFPAPIPDTIDSLEAKKFTGGPLTRIKPLGTPPKITTDNKRTTASDLLADPDSPYQELASTLDVAFGDTAAPQEQPKPKVAPRVDASADPYEKPKPGEPQPIGDLIETIDKSGVNKLGALNVEQYDRLAAGKPGRRYPFIRMILGIGKARTSVVGTRVSFDTTRNKFVAAAGQTFGSSPTNPANQRSEAMRAIAEGRGSYSPESGDNAGALMPTKSISGGIRNTYGD